jgi:diguanylate cyclase (GGDEF)-like protein
VTVADRQLSEILSEFARTMLTDFPIQRILEELVSRIVELMAITGAGVTLISDTSSPHFVAASDEAALRYEELQTAHKEGPCVLAYRSGEAVAISDLNDEVRFPAFASAALEAGLVAVFTFPLRQGARQLGALDLYRDSPGPLDDEDMVIAQTLADVVSAYLVNAQGRSDLLDSSLRAQEVALHDPLTGLPNRVLLLERIRHAVLNSRRSHKHVAVMFIDLDGFKRINDVSGHKIGDDLLIGVSARVSNMLRPGDTLARLSGDEFVIICADLDEQDQVEGIAARLGAAIGAPFDLDGTRVTLSASIGIAFAEMGHDPERLLQRADTAMYQAKRKGGGIYQVIDASEQALSEYNDSLTRDLVGAVARQEFRLEYQPVVSVPNGQVNSVEALLRWDHPVQGLIPPAVLIPLAETSGAIIEIGAWVLEQACADRRRWTNAAAAGSALTMAVNVSAHQLMVPGFVAMVQATMAATGTLPESLCLEVTETAFVHDADRALDVLSQLKEIGVQVALDDFGTGYSSLSFLMQYPVDIVKIDQSFIQMITESTASHAIVAKTIELAHLLDLVVVCEGVETADQDRQVTALTTDFRQGFYFARPMSAEMIDDKAGADRSAWTIAG